MPTSRLHIGELASGPVEAVDGIRLQKIAVFQENLRAPGLAQALTTSSNCVPAASTRGKLARGDWTEDNIPTRQRSKLCDSNQQDGPIGFWQYRWL